MPPTETTLSSAGLTVREVARRYRVSPDKIRSLIKAGKLGAINTASAQCGRPRFVVLPHHLDKFERQRSAGPPPKRTSRQKRSGMVDYYPD